MKKDGMADKGVVPPGNQWNSMKMGSPGAEQRRHMLAGRHRQTLWIYWSLILLGCWLLASPVTFGYHTGTVIPAGGREVYLPVSIRATILGWNDLFCGAALVFLGWRALKGPRARWAAAGVGLWLNAAPLLFWAPMAAAYLNDTLVGILVIGCSVLIPGLPNQILYERRGSAVPPGWSFNPSAWPKRTLMMGLALAGWLVARYLSSFQLGYIGQAWDPIFGNGSRQVLTSFISEMVPVSDGGLGALIYTIDFLLLGMGGIDRWRTAPWVVAALGILMVPLGLAHITLIGLQATVVGHWCTLCLLMAAIALTLIPLETAEVLATLQFLRQKAGEGVPLRRAFWLGAEETASGAEPERPQALEQPGPNLDAMTHGLTPSWTLLLSLGLGVWLLSAPAVLHSRASAATMEHVLGTLVLGTSAIALGEVVRAGRLLNLGLGLLIAGLSFLPGSTTASRVNDICTGLVIAGLSLPRGRISGSYGTWTIF